MSKEDIDRVKSMLTQMNVTSNEIDVSDTESVILVDEDAAGSPTPDIIIEKTDFGGNLP